MRHNTRSAFGLGLASRHSFDEKSAQAAFHLSRHLNRPGTVRKVPRLAIRPQIRSAWLATGEVQREAGAVLRTQLIRQEISEYCYRVATGHAVTTSKVQRARAAMARPGSPRSSRRHATPAS
jgi:hypothetical protein